MRFFFYKYENRPTLPAPPRTTPHHQPSILMRRQASGSGGTGNRKAQPAVHRGTQADIGADTHTNAQADTYADAHRGAETNK